jgi:DNA-binding transcriptional regulator YdaS (Cro superfamily)
MNALNKAIDLAGGVTALAELLKTTPQVIVNWRARKSVPPERCADIEAATKGEVTREQLRPDIFGRAA